MIHFEQLWTVLSWVCVITIFLRPQNGKLLHPPHHIIQHHHHRKIPPCTYHAPPMHDPACPAINAMHQRHAPPMHGPACLLTKTQIWPLLTKGHLNYMILLLVVALSGLRFTEPPILFFFQWKLIWKFSVTRKISPLGLCVCHNAWSHLSLSLSLSLSLVD